MIKHFVLILFAAVFLGVTPHFVTTAQTTVAEDLRLVFMVQQSGNMDNSAVDPDRARFQAVREIVHYLSTFYYDFLTEVADPSNPPPNISISVNYFRHNVMPIEFKYINVMSEWIDLGLYRSSVGLQQLNEDLEQWLETLDASACRTSASNGQYDCDDGDANYGEAHKGAFELLTELGGHENRRTAIVYIGDGLPCDMNLCGWPVSGEDFTTIHNRIREVKTPDDYSVEENGPVTTYFLGMGSVYGNLRTEWSEVIEQERLISNPASQLYPTLVGVVTDFLQESINKQEGIETIGLNRGGLLGGDENDQRSVMPNGFSVPPFSQQMHIFTAFGMPLATEPNALLQVTHYNPDASTTQYDRNHPSNAWVNRVNSENATMHLPEIWRFSNPYPLGWSMRMLTSEDNNLFANNSVYIAVKNTRFNGILVPMAFAGGNLPHGYYALPESANQIYQYEQARFAVAVDPPYPIRDYALADKNINLVVEVCPEGEVETCQTSPVQYDPRLGYSVSEFIPHTAGQHQIRLRVDDGNNPHNSRTEHLATVQVIPVDVRLTCSHRPTVVVRPMDTWHATLRFGWQQDIPGRLPPSFDHVSLGAHFGSLDAAALQPFLMTSAGLGQYEHRLTAGSGGSYMFTIAPSLPDGFSVPLIDGVVECYMPIDDVSLVFDSDIQDSIQTNTANQYLYAQMSQEDATWAQARIANLTVNWRITYPDGQRQVFSTGLVLNTETFVSELVEVARLNLADVPLQSGINVVEYQLAANVGEEVILFPAQPSPSLQVGLSPWELVDTIDVISP